MLPTAKITPSCSLQTAGSIRADLRVPSAWNSTPRRCSLDSTAAKAPYAGLPVSPIGLDVDAPLPQRRRVPRARLWPTALLATLGTWLRAWPQTAFFLLVVGCSYASGLHATSQLTYALLAVARVPHAAANAQHQHASASAALENTTSCVTDAALAHATVLKVALAQHTQHVRDAVVTNAIALDRIEDRVAACSKLFVRAFKTSTGATAQCFTTAFVANEDTNAARASPQNRSQELVDYVRALLITRVVSATNESFVQLLPQASSSTNATAIAVARLEHSVDAVFTAVHTALTASDSDSDDAVTSHEVLLQDVDSATLLEALVPTQLANDVFEALRTALQQHLQVLSPAQHSALETLWNATVVAEWHALERRIHALKNRSFALHHELAQAVESAAIQARSSLASTTALVADAKAHVERSVDSLHAELVGAFRTEHAAQTHAWRDVDAQLQALTRPTMLRPLIHVRRHCRDLELVVDDVNDGNRTDVVAQRQHTRLPFALNGSSDNTVDRAPTLSSIALLRLRTDSLPIAIRAVVVAGLDLLHTAIDVVYALDFARVVLQLAEVAAALWTDSFSVLPPVDVRGISTIQNISDAWTLLRCQHDVQSVCYFVMTQAEALLQVVAAYAAWLAVAGVGTYALVTWRRDFLRVCRDDNSNEDDATAPPMTQTTLASILPIDGAASHPERESALWVDKTHEDAQHRLWRIANASERTWTNHTATLVAIETHEQTLATLTQLLDTCAFEHNITSVSISDACLRLDGGSVQTLEPLPSSLAPNDLLAMLGSHSDPLEHCVQATDLPRIGSMSPVSAMHRVRMLHRTQACAAEQSLYLIVASWWLLGVVWGIMRFLARTAVAAAALLFWRELSAQRLEVVGFCYDTGALFAPETLPRAVASRLRDVRWLLLLRGMGVGVAVALCVTIWHLVLHRML